MAACNGMLFRDAPESRFLLVKGQLARGKLPRTHREGDQAVRQSNARRITLLTQSAHSTKGKRAARKDRPRVLQVQMT